MLIARSCVARVVGEVNGVDLVGMRSEGRGTQNKGDLQGRCADKRCDDKLSLTAMRPSNSPMGFPMMWKGSWVCDAGATQSRLHPPR